MPQVYTIKTLANIILQQKMSYNMVIDLNMISVFEKTILNNTFLCKQNKLKKLPAISLARALYAKENSRQCPHQLT